MNEKEIGELRRHLRADRCAVNALYGCFVNDKKEIVSTFRQSLAMTPSDDAEAILNIVRKALSGTVGKNLLSLPFTTEQVMDSDEHRLFSALRQQDETGEQAIMQLFEQTAATLRMESPYLILLAQDSYDVPAFGKDGLDGAESTDVFTYCICAVCPVKETKPALGFFPSENAFKSLMSNRVIAAPELGFMFPSFDDRCANIYDLLYYTKNAGANHPEFIEEVVHTAVPMPADLQKDTFNDVLESALSDACSLDVAMELREAICEQLEDAKMADDDEPPVVSKKDVSRILRKCGVEESRVETFEAEYQEAFGNTDLPPKNIVNPKQIEVQTPDVQIRVNPDRPDLIDTRTIDGIKYILIRAENGVSVNGMQIKIGE
ncbi:MAG: DUF4317 domain-containing protein [Clostridia bacterium]|nr:DUF4317 domain-containing protein [Clostridia bacterium]